MSAETLKGIWLDRDLTWLDFNERVLAEALDERTPLLERAKFLAIFTANLDEFFMKRIAVLRLEIGWTLRTTQAVSAVAGQTAGDAPAAGGVLWGSIVPAGGGPTPGNIRVRRWTELIERQHKNSRLAAIGFRCRAPVAGTDAPGD